MEKKIICITGATGVMGMATMRELARRLDRFEVIALARPGKKNRKKLAEFERMGMKTVWGDLMELSDVKRAAGEADFILHLGGMVSPAADYYPERTLKVNVEAARNVARAVMEGSKPETAKVVNIGSVAELGDRRPPHHWGRTGDPLTPSKHDAYALSKVLAELEILNSGLKHWVCLRQTAILHPGLLSKGTDPISFHVPLRGLLEWVTLEDSARLMANICEAGVPDSFWNNFYNVGSGESYRLTNYEFEKMLLKALGCPPPQRCFEAEWFATRNFHGQWWQDSDKLEEIVPFRKGESIEEYFDSLARSLPWYFKPAGIVPASLIRAGMKMVAKRRPLGPLYWLSHGIEDKIATHFGSREEQAAIAPWSGQTDELENYPAGEPRGRRKAPEHTTLSHGYEESKPESGLGIEDMRQKAESESGECLSETMTRGDLSQKLKWRCRHGHIFEATGAAVLKGGHWCPECLKQTCAVF